MFAPPPYRDTEDGANAGPERGPAPGAPRWVKVSAIIALALVVLFVVQLLTGSGGRHGPGNHTPSASIGNAPASGGH